MLRSSRTTTREQAGTADWTGRSKEASVVVGIEMFIVYGVSFIAVAIVIWLVFSLVWFVGGRIGRATGASAKVDHLLDTDGVTLPDEERIKDDGGFREGIGGL
jgi:hypothetical protein